MNVLNWAGLVVNGGVAFVFPLVVCGVFFYRQARRKELTLSPLHIRAVRSPCPPGSGREQRDYESGRGGGGVFRNGFVEIDSHDAAGPGSLVGNVEEHGIPSALPRFLIPYRLVIITSISVLFTAMIAATIVLTTMDMAKGTGHPASM